MGLRAGKSLACLCAAAVFGCLVPPLICLLPLLIFSQLCALAVAREAQQVHFGMALASNILVQKPLNVFRYLCFVSSCCVNIWIFIDLGFDLAAVILFVVLNLFSFACSSYQWRETEQMLLQPQIIPFLQHIDRVEFGFESNELSQRPKVIEFVPNHFDLYEYE